MRTDNTAKEREHRYIEELLGKIDELKERIGSYMTADKTFIHILPEPAREKEYEINAILKDRQFDLRFGGFLGYGDYLQLGCVSDGRRLYSGIESKKELLSKKYDLKFTKESPLGKIHFRKDETDILYVHPFGLLTVYLKFPQITDLLEDILEV